MLMDYIILVNNQEFYFEGNCTKEILKEMIKDYKDIIKKPTIKGLYKYMRQQGYRIDEMIKIDKAEAEAIFILK
jgi:hypothetical protein